MPSIQLQEVCFNWDANATECAAINLYDYAADGQSLEFVRPPEWASGDAPKAVAYATSWADSPVRIGARFSCAASRTPLQVRAVQSLDDGGRLRLGASRPTTVTCSDWFGFEFESHDLLSAGIGVAELALEWQFSEVGSLEWQGFGKTQHRVFSVLDCGGGWWPKEIGTPGLRTPYVPALELACDWTSGTTEGEAVAAQIAMALSERTQLTYASHERMKDCGKEFNLRHFVEDVASGEVREIDCTAGSSAVCLLSNLVGDDLVRLRLFNVKTQEVRPIGASQPWSCHDWVNHTVAARRTGEGSYLVYDGCLRFRDETCAEGVVPIGIPCNLDGSGEYIDRLVRPDERSSVSVVELDEERPRWAPTGTQHDREADESKLSGGC